MVRNTLYCKKAVAQGTSYQAYRLLKDMHVPMLFSCYCWNNVSLAGTLCSGTASAC